MNEIKEYIAYQVKKVSSSFKEWSGDSSYEDVPSAKIDNTYICSFGDIDSDVNGKVSTNTYTVEVRLSKAKKNKEGQTNMQTCLDLGMRIRSEILNPLNFYATNIANIQPLKMSVRPSQNNPDIYETTINLNFEVNQSL